MVKKLQQHKLQATKIATYGVMHFIVAVTVAYALTGSLPLALSIGLIEPLVQTVAFAFHDRVWRRIEGRKANEEAESAGALGHCMIHARMQKPD